MHTMSPAALAVEVGADDQVAARRRAGGRWVPGCGARLQPSTKSRWTDRETQNAAPVISCRPTALKGRECCGRTTRPTVVDMKAVDPPPSPMIPRRYVVAAIARLVASTAGLVALYFVLPLNRASGGATLVLLAAGLAGFAVIVTVQVRAILHASYPGLRAVAGFGAAIPLFVLVFASTYLSMAAADLAAFSEPLSHTDALYFTVTVFSTVGFGDITPRSEGARLVTTVQMIGGLVVLGLLARVVVGAVQTTRQRQRDPTSVTEDRRPAS